MKKIAVVGAGLTGSVIGYRLAHLGFEVDLFESRDHLGGNCYSERDPKSGVMVHKYGAHIFHTDDENVWRFVNKFAVFMAYSNRVKAVTGGRVFSLPINLLTINQFFNTVLSPKEAEEFIGKKTAQHNFSSKTFQDVALVSVGKDLYEAFYEGYTTKQWGVSPNLLPGNIFCRLPVRFNYNDNYFDHRFQGIPQNGYNEIFEKLIDHPHITPYMGQQYTRELNTYYDHVFYSGPLDAYFSCELGRLGYRTLDFEIEYADGDFQGCAVVNYCEAEVPFTRIIEHKHFAPWENHNKTIYFKEYSRTCEDGDVPYYPVRMATEEALLKKYLKMADSENGVTFVGRLGTFRYLDMDDAIKEAFTAVERYIANEQANGM